MHKAHPCDFMHIFAHKPHSFIGPHRRAVCTKESARSRLPSKIRAQGSNQTSNNGPACCSWLVAAKPSVSDRWLSNRSAEKREALILLLLLLANLPFRVAGHVRRTGMLALGFGDISLASDSLCFACRYAMEKFSTNFSAALLLLMPLAGAEVSCIIVSARDSGRRVGGTRFQKQQPYRSHLGDVISNGDARWSWPLSLTTISTFHVSICARDICLHRFAKHTAAQTLPPLEQISTLHLHTAYHAPCFSPHPGKERWVHSQSNNASRSVELRYPPLVRVRLGADADVVL